MGSSENFSNYMIFLNMNMFAARFIDVGGKVLNPKFYIF
jgi:hypothetical protein